MTITSNSQWQKTFDPVWQKTIITGRANPAWWVNEILGVKLWLKQQEIIRSVFRNPRTTVRSCETAGKTCVAACSVLAFLYNYPPATVLTTAPTYRQVAEILWREIALKHQQSTVVLAGNLTSTRLDLGENWFALGLSTDEPVRFQGFHNEHVLVVVDEASGVPPQIYQAIENPLAAGHTRVLLIGNPTEVTGDFRNSFTSPLYNTFQISAFDTPNFTQFGITLDDIKDRTWRQKMSVTDEEVRSGKWATFLPFPTLIAPLRVEERLQEWGEGSFAFQCYVMGDFPETGDTNLFSLAEVKAAVNRQLTPDVVNSNEVVAAVDIARYGDSETVLIKRRGNRVDDLQVWQHKDILYTSGRLANYLKATGPALLRIDATGYGGDDAAFLKDQGFNVEPVLVGRPAGDKERFANIRSEMYFQLKKLFQDGLISIPDDRKLIHQLCDIRYGYSSAGKLLMESKEQMRSRGSKSPDRADALALCFMPVKLHTKPPVVVHW